PKLLSWPYVCNGCRLRNYHCPKRWQAEYRAARAQALADEELSASRRGIDKTREQFEHIMGCVKEGLARGLSPEQIVVSYALDVSPATIYRWIEEGYAGTGNIELRREVSYKPRKKKAAPRSTSHGAERSYAAFLGLGEEERSSACEMDTVIGRVHDSKCLLTLYLRPCKFQLMLLLGGKTAEEAAGALDALEEAVGMDGFGRLFDPILTDNGAEFSDHVLIERSAGDSAARRARVFYCDVRQSQQKGSCERNHVELRKVLPKGTSFDALTRADCALLMSHVNSEPRPSLAGLSPIRMFRLAYGGLAERLLDALGVEEIGPGELNLTPSLLAREEGRGMTI
uniref:IS30 family transposase n=1 Tax=Olsenella sp. AGMB03486 TaxID=3230364 RepID=UPI0034A096A0